MKRTNRRLTLAALGLRGGARTDARVVRALAQSITIVREIDSDRYDPHRSTARGASEVLFMLADTLVSLDYDMKTVTPGLADSWSVSEDGKTYTFKLRQDVKFCDGKPMKAEDVVYSLKRWIDPETKSPVRWRAGKVADIAATDDYTVEYKLKRALLGAAVSADPELRRHHRQGHCGQARRRLRRQGLQRHRPVLLGRMAAAQRDEAQAQRGLQMGAADLREPRARARPGGDLEDRAGGEYAPRRAHDRAEPDHAVHPLFRLPHHPRQPGHQARVVEARPSGPTSWASRSTRPRSTTRRCAAPW